LIFAAFVISILDGRIARWRQKNSVMGREIIDSQVSIAFGIAFAENMDQLADASKFSGEVIYQNKSAQKEL
jgi:phosphatidylserine synthase